jgi:Hypothetical glycosyl hydrolase 6
MRLSVGLCATAAIFSPLHVRAAETGWWMKEPIRWVQTNLRERDAALDPDRLVNQLSEMRANVLLIGMGGIAAFYPTETEFPSRYLRPGTDLFGQVLLKAHANKIRVVGRFDFSKTRKEVYDAHPKWFFRKADGSPAIYNGLYSTCINGGYYREQAIKILTEGLQKYDVDGLFFNAFGNQARDYSGKELGLCHCDVCARKYKAMFGRAIPEEPDDNYRRFMFVCSREVAALFGEVIHKLRPHAGYFNYVQESTDGIMSESNTAVNRPLPLWPYSASDNVNRGMNGNPGKMAVNLDMQFVDYWWRFATVPQQEIALRLFENVANGGALAFEVNGTLDQQDRQAIETAKPIFRWMAENEQYCSRQESAARVLLLGSPEETGHSYSQSTYRGLFRLLSEEHIPFAVSDHIEVLKQRAFDLVVTGDWAPRELAEYAQKDGRVLIVSHKEPEFPVAPVIERVSDLRGYFRVRDHSKFPSLRDTDLMMTNGPYTEVQTSGATPDVTLIPPSLIGPPELVHVDMKDTEKPGLVIIPKGKGTVAWIPWDLASLYYRQSLPAHAGLFRDVCDRLLPRRQLKTDAHPLVEMTWMTQGERHLLHLVNLSGHSQTGYFAPVAMRNIHVQLEGHYTSARAVRANASVPVKVVGNHLELTVPELSDYELLVLE